MSRPLPKRGTPAALVIAGGINRAMFETPPVERIVRPRTLVRQSRDGLGLPNGHEYEIRHEGVIVASGWTAGDRAQAMTDATARIAAFDATGEWTLDAAETAGAA